MSRIFRRTVTTSCAVVALGATLAACSPPNQNDSELKVNTAVSGVAPTQTVAPSTSSRAASTAAPSAASSASASASAAPSAAPSTQQAHN
ncbi:MAG: hypothetical protein Q4A82_08020 [Corynebacterium sp.]|nr:hypothetical protein [Corynebacterium sp.]